MPPQAHALQPPQQAGPPDPSARPARKGPLANRNFRLLWLGETVSMFGDQFYVVALPWLVFQLTGSSLAFGSVLMVAGIPRAVLMLFGGVFTDRFSPRTVMFVSNVARLIITLALVVLAAGEVVPIWVLFVVAFCFGVADAFFLPAYRAMIPHIVEPDMLQPTNALHQSSLQLVQIIGPGVAGVVVRAVGMVAAFVFDALTFLFTVITLGMMRPPSFKPATEGKRPGTAGMLADMLTEIGAMLNYVRKDVFLRTLLIVVAVVNLAFSGPLIVGSATLARVRFPEGSAGFGAMLSCFAIGVLVGALLAGMARTRWAGVISLIGLIGQGLLLVAVAQVQTLVMACAIFVVIGLTAGFGSVTLMTLTQTHVSREMLGRFMSLVALAEVGLNPISHGISGWFADQSVSLLFIIAGTLLSVTAFMAVMNPVMRQGAAIPSAPTPPTPSTPAG